ncbi:MAG: hypothetical protein ACOYMN_10155 [Roseimicrobium sp.]
MGRHATLLQLRKNFEADLKSAQKLVAAVRPLMAANPKLTPRSLHTKQVYRVVELAFLGVVAEWETFIEESFVRYLTGVASPNGVKPQLNAGKASNIEHSYQVISQNPAYDPASHYLKFGDPKWTHSQAKFFFANAGTFSCIHTDIARLQEAVKLRNRAAHNSEKCKADFKEVALSYIAPANSQLPQGYRLGELLSQPATRHFGNAAKNGDYFEVFIQLYTKLALQVAPSLLPRT